MRSSAVGMWVWVPRTAVTLAVEMPAHGDFLAGGLGVEVEQDDLRFEAGDEIGGEVEWVVGAAHEDLTHKVHHCVRQTLVGAVGDDAFVNSVAGQAGLHVGGAQDAAGAGMAVGGD